MGRQVKVIVLAKSSNEKKIENKLKKSDLDLDIHRKIWYNMYIRLGRVPDRFEI